jgi:hypothetical protein
LDGKLFYRNKRLLTDERIALDYRCCLRSFPRTLESQIAALEGWPLPESESRNDKSLSCNPSQSMRAIFDSFLTCGDSNRSVARSDNYWSPEPFSSRGPKRVSDCEPCPFGFCLERIQIGGLRLRSKINRVV